MRPNYRVNWQHSASVADRALCDIGWASAVWRLNRTAPWPHLFRLHGQFRADIGSPGY